MTGFLERYTGQPSPGASIPLPIAPRHDPQTSSTIPPNLLATLRITPITTGQVLGRLGFLDSPIMRKLVARELQALGFEAKPSREPGSFAVIKRWTHHGERG